MQMSFKQKAAGAVAAMVLGLATVGAGTIPASAAMGGGGGIHVGGGGGSFHGGMMGGGAGAFHGGGGAFHGGTMGGQAWHDGGGSRFQVGGLHHHFDHRFVGFGGYYGPYYDCGSPYALLNPYVCPSYPYGY